MGESAKTLLEKGVSEKAFPGGVLVFGRPAAGEAQGCHVGFEGLTRHKVRVSPETVYDLASITKVAATTTLAMLATDKGLLALDAKISELGLNIPKHLSSLTVLDLMAHRSGLPAWRPFYLDSRLKDKARLSRAIFSERLLFPPGSRTLYSDLNFMLTGMILEGVWKAPLADLFGDLVASPLRLKSTGFGGRRFSPAPTEDGPRIGGPLDYPGVPVLGPVPTGRVHDDNAAALDGAAGHAGLFGTAPEIFRIIRVWALSLKAEKDQSPFIRKETMEDFSTPRPTCEDKGRAAGFDLGSGPIEGAVGHLGYTGGALWWNPARDEAIVFLCNRVHPTARNLKMPQFRESLYRNLGWAPESESASPAKLKIEPA